MNLADGIVFELKRNRELRDEYHKIPTGAFGVAVLTQKIDEGEAALASGDIHRIIQAYDALKESA